MSAAQLHRLEVFTAKGWSADAVSGADENAFDSAEEALAEVPALRKLGYPWSTYQYRARPVLLLPEKTDNADPPTVGFQPKPKPKPKRKAAPKPKPKKAAKAHPGCPSIHQHQPEKRVAFLRGLPAGSAMLTERAELSASEGKAPTAADRRALQLLAERARDQGDDETARRAEEILAI